MKVPVLIYTTAGCPYCQRAERLLVAKGVLDIARIRVDLEPQRRSEMTQKTGCRSVPQIFIGNHHIGGFEELAALDRGGGLDSLLRGEPA